MIHYLISLPHNNIDPRPDFPSDPDGVFTTFVATPDGAVFCLERHYDRLKHAAEMEGITWPWQDVGQFESLIQSFCSTTLDTPKVIRISLFSDQCIFSVRDIPPRQTAVSLKTVQFNSVSPGIKKLIRITEASSHLQAVEDDFLRISRQGLITEASFSNIFLITQTGELLTPDPQQVGCLPGILRHALLNACTEKGIPFTEAAFTTEALKNLRGAFLTNAVRGITPIEKIDHRRYENAETTTLRQALMQGLRSQNKHAPSHW